MFRITRGILIQHAPAFPVPALRFPDGSPMPIYGDDEPPPSEGRAEETAGTPESSPEA